MIINTIPWGSLRARTGMQLMTSLDMGRGFHLKLTILHPGLNIINLQLPWELLMGRREIHNNVISGFMCLDVPPEFNLAVLVKTNDLYCNNSEGGEGAGHNVRCREHMDPKYRGTY